MNPLFSHTSEKLPLSKPHDPRRSFGTDLTNLSVHTILIKESQPNSQSPNNYTRETSNYMHNIENRLHPQYGYMKSQTDINEKMRAMLIDWLVEVHLKFKLFPETLYLTVNLVDRFLEKEALKRQKLQLVGVTAMFIASKYEELYAPVVKDFAYITDRAFSIEEIVSMERHMLRVLDYNITTPSPLRFVEIYSEGSSAGDRSICLIRYIIELSYIEYKMIRYLPSLIAASAIYLAGKIFGEFELAENSPYNEDDLKLCARDMCVLLQGAKRFPLQAVRNKYLHQNYFEVANVDVIGSRK